MAHMLLPAAGKSTINKTDEFTFYKLNHYESPGCYGFDCEDIPQYIFDYKYTDYSQEKQKQSSNNETATNRWPFPPNSSDTETPSSNDGGLPGKNLRTDGAHAGTQKRPTVPMSNCQPLCCEGSRCACLAPEDALWGSTPHDVSTCAWKLASKTAKMRVPDQQLVRPLDKSLPQNKRPTGHPYFTHGAPTCFPHQAPIAKGSGFNFDQWLATREDREPPAHLRGQCISSVCTMCGPLTVECCPGYQIPQNYTLAKRG